MIQYNKHYIHNLHAYDLEGEKTLFAGKSTVSVKIRKNFGLKASDSGGGSLVTGQSPALFAVKRIKAKEDAK